MININKCPVTATDLQEFITCKDYLQSQESFSIKANQDKSILITSPRPKDEDLGGYYDSPEYISHTDSSKSLFDQVYKIIRGYALKSKLNLINTFDGNKQLLDYGCGTGDFLETAKKGGWNIQGIEPSDSARSIAEEKLSIAISLPSDLFKMQDNSYDVISLWHVLEHVPNLMEVSHQLSKLLKPGGHLILALPNFKSADAKKFKEKWAAFDVPRHLWHFSPSGIKHLSKKIGLVLKDQKPMPFDSFYVSMLSNKQALGKIKPVASFLSGLTSNMKAKQTANWSSLIYILEKPKEDV